ncbi:MAG: SCP2 sterol-binding domain-containing protein [Gammaproteobacteria bacterium]|nr:SCP2 sterol-binding domain-containing protein [Gammaproteobacteria bacterium]
MPLGSDLESLFARLAESMANATLRLDKGSTERLAALEGRSIQVESTGPAQVFTVRVSDARIEVTPGPVDSPDALVRGRFQDLVAWLAAPNGSAAERVEIDGDPAVPADLAELFRQLAPLGLPLPIRGDDLLGAVELAGAVIGSAAEGAARAWRQIPAQPFVNRDRFGDAREDIEALRADVGSLTARVEALESARREAAETEEGEPAQGDGQENEATAAPPPEDASQ